MSRIVGILTAVGAILAPVAVATSAHAAFPGANGRIAYAVEEYPTLSDAAGYFNLTTILPDGTRARAFGNATGPVAFSPDGRRVLYEDGYAGDLRIAPASGRGRERKVKFFTDSGPVYQYAGAPDWSPTGRRIVFQRVTTDGPAELWIYYFNGDRRLTEGADPAWSVRGDIAFSMPSEAGGIGVIRPDGSGLHHVSDHGTTPDWSPDGSRIVFTTDSGRIAVIRADGSGLRRLPVTGSEPSFSPDGKKIVFLRGESVCTMTTTGRHVRRLRSYVSHDEEWAYPCLRPTGSLICVRCDRRGVLRRGFPD